MGNYITGGSVSHGTMKTDDLIPAFLNHLDYIKEQYSFDQSIPEVIRCANISRLDTAMGQIEQRMNEDDYFESEDADYDLEFLFDELDNFAPDNHYFGAHTGGGSDYGFWECDDMN